MRDSAKSRQASYLRDRCRPPRRVGLSDSQPDSHANVLTRNTRLVVAGTILTNRPDMTACEVMQVWSLPIRCDRSRLCLIAACNPHNVQWSALKCAPGETESVPALRLRCGIDVHSYAANRVGRVCRFRPAVHISLRHTRPHFGLLLNPRPRRPFELTERAFPLGCQQQNSRRLDPL